MFKQDDTITPVIFRKFPKERQMNALSGKHELVGGEVIALFPADTGTYDAHTCGSYMHVGQHGSAEVSLMADTRPATPSEYTALKAELEGAPYGYRLKVYARMQPAFRKARGDQLKLGG